MKFDLDFNPPASDRQRRFIQGLMERLDGKRDGSYADMDLGPLTTKEASAKIETLQGKLTVKGGRNVR